MKVTLSSVLRRGGIEKKISRNEIHDVLLASKGRGRERGEDGGAPTSGQGGFGVLRLSRKPSTAGRPQGFSMCEESTWPITGEKKRHEHEILLFKGWRKEEGTCYERQGKAHKNAIDKE